MLRAKRLLAASMLGFAVAILVLVGVASRAQDVQDLEGDVGRLNAGPSTDEEVELTEGLAPNAVPFFKRIAGLSFHPLDSNVAYGTAPGGCLYQTGSGGDFASDIQVPDGAVIDYLRVYFYDTDGGSDAVAELYAYDGAGNSTLIASAVGSGTPAYGSAVSELFSHYVDNAAEALAVVLDFQGASTDALRICGIRIRYQFNRINLPLVLKQAQP